MRFIKVEAVGKSISFINIELVTEISIRTDGGANIWFTGCNDAVQITAEEWARIEAILMPATTPQAPALSDAIVQAHRACLIRRAQASDLTYEADDALIYLLGQTINQPEITDEELDS